MRTATWMIVASLGWMSCGDDNVTPRDSGGGAIDAARPDAGGFDAGTEDVVAPDAGPADGGPADTGPAPEPCDRPGATEMLTCGFCGSQTRFCTSARVWEYSICEEREGAMCSPGTRGDAACGMCGTQQARCTEDCKWEPTGECGGESGECLAGAAERTTDGCPPASSRGRTCGATCTWGPYSECRDRPSDFDGDGSPYGTDCDDTNPAIRVGSIQPCGSFVCGSTSASGTQSCVGPGWGSCDRPAGCAEPTGACAMSPVPLYEIRPCPGVCFEGGQQDRRCDPGSTWTAWSGTCAPPFTALPAPCLVTEAACGACGEGIAYGLCGAGCLPAVTGCLGTGCTPGARRPTTEGCPDGQYAVRECGPTCAFGPPSACMPRPTGDVEIVLLLDVTGSQASVIQASTDVIVANLVAPLVATPGVRVGLAVFGDFPFPPYGDPMLDAPFLGLVAPTDDTGEIASALRTIVPMPGGDGPESGMEALWVLAGGTPHPSSRPLSCPAGTEPGGCWMTGSRRAVVIVTDVSQHNAPHPALPAGMLVEPYTMLPPPPAPEWAMVRDQMSASGVALFAIVPGEPRPGDVYAPQPQLELLTSDLGQEPGASIVTYTSASPPDLAVVTSQAADLLSAHFGL